MKIERTKNATRNIIWGVIEKIVGIILPFLSRTLFIYFLGAEYLGLNSLFTSILSVLSLAELGMGSALVFSMYKPIAEDDKDTICALLNLYKKVYRIIGTIILVAGLCITPFIEFFIKGKSYPADINIYVIYLIYLFNTCCSYFMFAYKVSLLDAHQRRDVTSKITLVLTVSQQIVQMILLVAFRNYYAYVLIQPIFVVLANLIRSYKVDKLYPKYKCKGNISPELKSDIKKKIVGLLSYKIYGVVFSAVDTIVISKFLGLTTLAIYQNYNYILTSVAGFVSVLTASLTAGIGNSLAVESRDKNYNDLKKFFFLYSWIIGWCSVCFVCLFQHFMVLWIGEALTFTIDTMVIIVINFMINKMADIAYEYRVAAGLWWEDRFRPIIAAIVNLSLNIYMVQRIGMNGVILSTLICTIVINIPWGTHILFKIYFRRSPKEYYSKFIQKVIVTTIVAIFTYFTCDLLPDTGLIPLLIKGIICCIVPNILFWLAYCREKEYSEAKKIMSKICGILSRKSR